jgi:hypothetical protein
VRSLVGPFGFPEVAIDESGSWFDKPSTQKGQER